jgi:hypothetical protein
MKLLSPLKPTEIPERITDEHYDYIAAISFEDRDTAWTGLLHGARLKPRRVILFDYNTVVEPREENERRRSANRKAFQKYFSRSDIEIIEGVNPYAISSLARTMQRVITDASGTSTLIDLTCMTRVHALATVGVVAQSLSVAVRRTIYCYATPASYGFEIGTRACWKDVLFVPVGRPRLLRREGNAHGLVLAGHDGERLSVNGNDR